MLKRSALLFTMVLLCLAMIVLMLPPYGMAQDSSIIRVYLRRLKIEDSLSIQFEGNYMLDNGSMSFADGTKIDIALRNDQLVLHSNGIALVMGDQITFLRSAGEKSPSIRINDSDGRYEGDLALDIVDGCIRPILHIHVEDYLLGVVPFEMGDSFPLEALKAQAIAARTYALSKQGAELAYDVEDTTNDQAYKGRVNSHPVSERAVFETEGLVGTYQDNLAQCYYSASNGGQTELGQHVWPVENPEIYAYMDMRDDPYDIANEASSVKRYTIKKKPGEQGVGAALHTQIVIALSEQLEAMGFEAADDLVRIDEVSEVRLQTPKFEYPSRLMTELAMRVKVSVRDCVFRDSGVIAAVVPNQSSNAEETPVPALTPSPTATPAYSPYKKMKEAFDIVLPIFSEAEKAMGLSINVYQNELLTVADIGSAYMIESRRYGHGVGMSQRGAQEMAVKHGMSCDEILAFYYPGLVVKRFNADRAPLPTIDMHIMATPAPSPSPTPRPTLMPVDSNDLPRGAYIAVVTNIDDDSSLNLRQGPSLSSEILRRLYKNQRLIVLSTDNNGWSHVKTDVIEGYVKNEYLQAENK